MAHPTAVASVGSSPGTGVAGAAVARAGSRRAYLDWLRGVGVLIMIEAHTVDSWTRLADHTRPAYRWALVLGGFGAPIFLLLAGVALALAVASRVRRGMTDSEASGRARRRGWEVFGFAFLFRLQSLIISGGGMRAFLKVDILNVMGVSMLLAAALWTVCRTPARRAVALSAAAVITAMLTPLIRATPLLSWLPDPIEDYLRPAPNRTTFTLFPWGGFLFAGVVAGVWLESGWRDERWRNVVLLLAGLIVAAAGYGTSWMPSIYASSSFWTSSPTFFFLRLGLLVAAIPAAYAWTSGWQRVARWRDGTPWSPLQEFGLASLFVYWIHVEMVYGVVSTPLHHALSFEQALGAMAAFSSFLFGLVVLKKRFLRRRPKGEYQAKFAHYRVANAPGSPQSG